MSFEDYKTEKAAKLFDVNTLSQVGDIKKGQSFKILTKTEKELVKIGRSYHCKINYKGKTYLLPLGAVLKPTGKNVEFIKADLSQKIKKGVFRTFKGGIGHEERITKLFINGSGPMWEFEHNGKEYFIEDLGDPPWKGRGMPKTDVYVKVKPALPKVGSEIKLSLKQDNATYVDSWILPTRLEQLAGKSKAKKMIENMLKKVHSGEVGVRSPYMYWFTKTAPYNGEACTNAEKVEAASGNQKFGKSSTAAANCYYKGGVPENITTLISNLLPIENAVKDIGFSVRGYGADGNGACFMKSEKGEWEVTPKWKSYFGIK